MRLTSFLLDLLHPLVSGSVDVDELFVALVSDNCVLDLLPSSLLYFRLNLLGSFSFRYLTIQLGVVELLLVFGDSPDEDVCRK